MTDEITIKVDLGDVQQWLGRLARTATDPTPVLHTIGGIMADAADRAFINQADPVTGAKWAPLSAVTKARRGGKAGPILNISGRLSGSMQTTVTPDRVVVGTNVEYATTHQFGAAKGAFGRSKKGPIPWGDIPARPFLGLDDDDKEEILDAVKAALQG